MKKQKTVSHGTSARPRGNTPAAPSYTPLIHISHNRPDSIPTSVLHRSDIDYPTLQTHLKLLDHEMNATRRVLDTIIGRNPDFYDLNLRFTSERELLCRIANQQTHLFTGGIARKLKEQDQQNHAVGWLLYQLLLWCLKENQRTGKTRVRERSAAPEPSTVAPSTIGEDDRSTAASIVLKRQATEARFNVGPESVGSGAEDEDEQTISDTDDLPDEEAVHADDEDDEDDEEAEELQYMIDSIDLERELDAFEQEIEPGLVFRYGSPEQQDLLRRKNGNGTLPAPILPEDTISAGEESPIETLKFIHSSRCNMIFFLVCFTILMIALTTLSVVQYIHEKQGTSRLWDTILMHQRRAFPTVTYGPNTRDKVASLTITKATAVAIKKDL
ncbi:hypothetical protein ABW20_dc0101705 [Dactylellina cionopaga]|nr:hypothetical protein ABW20_dc0101705 [Dactylellina cionopaga]